MAIHEEPIERTEEQKKAEVRFIKLGHKPENQFCDHAEYVQGHGLVERCPTCGSVMYDAGM